MNTGADAERHARFDKIVAGFYPDMYRYAAWLSRDPGVAEVVVQESLLRAWRALDGLKQEELAKQWLLTIVRRENARYFGGNKPAGVDIDDLTPAQESMIAEAEDSELEDARQAIYKLEDAYREPLVLQVLMGYSCKEIGEMLGLTQAAVLTRLHRARIKLKEVIEGGCDRVRAAGQSDGL